MPASPIAVLDVGKTNVKLLAISADARVLAASGTPARSGGGVLETRPIEDWLRQELARVSAQFRPSALVVTTHGAAAALVDADGLAHPVVDYEAIPPADIDAAYDAIRPSFTETLSPRLPAGLNLGRQLYRIEQENPKAWARTRVVLTYPQYWAWRLTGTTASEVTSLGCHTDLWRPAAGTMSSLATRAGWAARFPPRRPAWESLGGLRPGWGDVGFAGEVLCGIHDSNAAYLRYLAGVEPPFVVVSTGTWVVCFNSAGEPAALDPQRDTLGNVDIRGRPVACSRFMGGREYALIAGEDGLALVPGAEDIAAVIARRLFALPSFAHTGGPFPGAKGSVTAPPRSPIEAAALATLYVALMTRESLTLTGPARTVYVDGPFAANAAFCGILAALLPEASVHAAEGSDGTAVGASLLARCAPDGSLPPVSVPARRVAPMPLALDAYQREWQERVA